MSDQLPSQAGPTADTNIKPGDPPFGLTPRSSETIAYQPISGWAIAGVIASGFFAFMVLVSTIVAIWQGAPMFFPVWFLTLAVIGIVLSYIGQNHVQNSEGTRTGGKLATIGIWLGVVSGLCYFSYFYATRYAQQAQADAFLRVAGPDAGFFPLLMSGSKDEALNSAFLLTRPFTSRSGNPKDPKSMALNNDTPGKEGGKGELSNFKESILPRVLFKKLGEEAEITPLAVQDWKYEKKSYQVSRIYSIKTKEIEMEMQVSVASIEAEASGQGRKWFVNLQETGPLKKNWTRYGEGIIALRGRAREWFETKWLRNLNAGEPFQGLKDLDQSAWPNMLLQDQKFEDLRAAVYRQFASARKDRLSDYKVLTRPDDIGFWEMVDGKVRIRLHFRINVMTDGNPPAPLRTLDAFADVEVRQVVDPATFSFDSAPPDWSLISITFTHSSLPGGSPLPQALN